MPSLRVPPTTLTTGTQIRIVDNGAGTTPRYILESPIGPDAMGVMRWQATAAYSDADIIAMLTQIGFLPA